MAGAPRRPAGEVDVTRGWRLTLVLLVLVVGGSFAVRGPGGEPAGLGVPALLFPGDGVDAAAAGEAAARAEQRLRDFLTRDAGPDSLVLDEAEVGAVLRRRLDGRLPRGVADLRVDLRGPTAAVSALVRFGELQTGGQAAHRLSQFMGDSARVELEVEPAVASPGTGHFTLRGLKAGGLQLPSGLLPMVLSQLGVPTADTGEPTVEVGVPPGISAIRVDDGELVLFRSGGTRGG